MQPFLTVAAGLDEVAMMGWEDAVLVLHAGSSFDEVAVVDSGAVAFVAAEGDTPQWVNTSLMEPTLSVSGAQTRVYLAGVRMRDGDTALVVSQAQVDVRDSELASNDILGLSCGEGARVDVRRSRIVANSGGGIVAQSGAELYLENCFVGGGAPDVDAIALTTANLDALYTTVGAGLGTTTALRCDAGSVVDVRNSILVSRSDDDELQCGTAVVNNSAAELDLGGTNSLVSAMDVAWFADFNGGDFLLTTEGAAPGNLIFENLAQWEGGDPPTDIDGDPRPLVDGTPDYAGADVP